MVLSDTDSLRSTCDGGAGLDTLLQRPAAHLLLPTLGVVGALVLGGQVTSIPVLGVARVAFKTVTESLVVAGSAECRVNLNLFTNTKIFSFKDNKKKGNMVFDNV